MTDLRLSLLDALAQAVERLKATPNDFAAHHALRDLTIPSNISALIAVARAAKVWQEDMDDRAADDLEDALEALDRMEVGNE